MTDAIPAPEPEEVREHRTWWWKEILIMGAFYFVYSLTRNRFGSIRVSGDDVPLNSFNNAMKVIRFERAVGLYHEESIQQLFLPYKWFIQFMNTYYGTAHFAVTIGVFFVLLNRRKDVFPLFRNALAAMTGLAIIGFALFPLMPPRLLDAPCPGTAKIVVDGQETVRKTFGGDCIPTKLRNYNGATEFGFVDTLKVYGGPWDFDSGGIASRSNQYAAMPSLHIGWASWCAFAIWPLARRKWIRAAVLLYPALTLFCIIVTGNHFWADGIGGILALAGGFILGGLFHNFNQKRLDKKFEQFRSSHPTSNTQ
jgi:membrane-associated phospholipid phosphatase